MGTENAGDYDNASTEQDYGCPSPNSISLVSWWIGPETDAPLDCWRSLLIDSSGITTEDGCTRLLVFFREVRWEQR